MEKLRVYNENDPKIILQYKTIETKAERLESFRYVNVRGISLDILFIASYF